MRGCSRFFAGILAVVFVITAVLTLLLSNLFTIATDRDIIKNSLSNLDRQVMETVPALVAQTLEQQARERGLATLNLDEALLQQSMEMLLPPGWLEAQASTAVDTVYEMLETGDLDNAELEINSSPIIDRFRGDAGREIVSNIVSRLPTCSQEANIPDFFAPTVTIPECLPAGVNIEQVSQEAHARLVQRLDNNPQISNELGILRVPLFPPANQAQNEALLQARAEMIRLQQTFSLIQTWGWLVWLLPAACLLLITLLAVRSLSEWGYWWGGPLTGTAVLLLCLGRISPAVFSYFLGPGAEQPLIGTNSLQQAWLPWQTAVSAAWLARVNWQAGLVLMAGTFFLLLGFLTRRNPTYGSE